MYQQSNLPARTNTVNSVQELLKKHKNQFAMVLPKSLSVDRLMRIVMSTVTINPKLLQCEQKSFLRSVLQSASLGLEPGGPLGLAHLVPFYNGARQQMECQLIVDYKGYIALAHNSGEVGRIHAAIIYEKEPWEWAKDGTLIHKPLPPSQRGEKKVMVFAKAFDKTGNLLAEKFLWAEEVEAIKTKALGNKKNTALNPWNTAEESMWLKSPVRRLAKWMPMAAEMQKAAVIEEYQEEGITPVLDVDLDMGEAPPATDAEQKTDEKANALREKLKQAQDQNKTGVPAGQVAEPGVEGREEAIQKFQKSIPITVDLNNLDLFLKKTAEANSASAEDVMISAAGDPENFWSAYKKWNAIWK